jgi:hypothetical protein
MAALAFARLLVAAVPFHHWRDRLGSRPSHPVAGPLPVDPLAEGQRLARQVERAAARLPFSTKCLPRAMALSWILRRKRIGHVLVFAVRPAGLRDGPDALHAWVEIEGVTVIGDLPGPWLETLRLGESPMGTGLLRRR